MKITYSRSNINMNSPFSRPVKKLVLIAWLQRTSTRLSERRLAHMLSKSSRQIERDLEEVGQYYQIERDVHGRPYIANPEVRTESLTDSSLSIYIKLYELLSEEEGKSIQELGDALGKSSRQVYRYLSVMEKVFDVDQYFNNKYFIYNDYSAAA